MVSSLSVGGGDGAVSLVLLAGAESTGLRGDLQPQVSGQDHGGAREEVRRRVCHLLPQDQVSWPLVQSCIYTLRGDKLSERVKKSRDPAGD